MVLANEERLDSSLNLENKVSIVIMFTIILAFVSSFNLNAFASPSAMAAKSGPDRSKGQQLHHAARSSSRPSSCAHQPRLECLRTASALGGALP